MAEGILKATMHNEIKLSNVIAKYSTFTTGITIEIPITTPDEFRNAIHRFHNEIIQAIQEFQNETLVKIGREPAWSDGKTAAPEEEKPAGKKVPRKS